MKQETGTKEYDMVYFNAILSHYRDRQIMGIKAQDQSERDIRFLLDYIAKLKHKMAMKPRALSRGKFRR